jgi:electron transport complex protein RnfC
MRTRTFRGGIHPQYGKELTCGKPVEVLPAPEKVMLFMSQHVGAPAEPLVKAGDVVHMGQKVGEAKGFISVPIHASVSGKVLSVGLEKLPNGNSAMAVVIENDGEDRIDPGIAPLGNPEDVEPEKLRELMREAGLVGMGGAAFPTHVKYQPPDGKKIDTIILNGAECEPFLTCDHRIMLEEAKQVVDGLRAMMHTAGAGKGVISIEVNKSDAIAAVERAIAGDPRLSVVTLATKYPQGEERMIIYATLRRIVPSGGLPIDVGVVVNNVATAAVFAEYLETGIPLISRIVTVTGKGVKTPKNLRVRLGTPIGNLLEYCDGFVEAPGRIIMGGPMTGPAVYHLNLPIMKGTSGLLVQHGNEVRKHESIACVRCGKCVAVCPYNLLPNFLGEYAEKGSLDQAEAYNIMDCRECGCCTFVCPSRRPLMQAIKGTKSKILAKRRKTG